MPIEDAPAVRLSTTRTRLSSHIRKKSEASRQRGDDDRDHAEDRRDARGEGGENVPEPFCVDRVAGAHIFGDVLGGGV